MDFAKDSFFEGVFCSVKMYLTVAFCDAQDLRNFGMRQFYEIIQGYYFVFGMLESLYNAFKPLSTQSVQHMVYVGRPVR